MPKGKKVTIAKAAYLMKAISRMPPPRKGKRGGMSLATKKKALATLKRKFPSLR